MTEIAGYYGQLSKDFRDLGYNVTFVDSSNNVFKYAQSEEVSIWFISLYRRFQDIRRQLPWYRFLEKIICVLSALILRVFIFCWALFFHDLFIFAFGTSLLPRNWDLPILKIFKKRIICNLAHGSDARPPYVDGFRQNENSQFDDVQRIYFLTKFIKKKCLHIERYADVILGAPLSCHFLSTRFVNHFFIGLPYSAKRFSANCSTIESGCTRILHAPSHPHAKGTYKIREAISSLKKKGHNIDFVEVLRQPNEVVLEELGFCDFVVDQMYSDTPLAGLATEAAWFGKPSVVGGYGWNVLQQFVPDEKFPPSQICHPDALEEAIEQLIVDSDYRQDMGRKAFEFVSKKWHSKRVAERYIKMFDGMVPEDWFLNPESIIYTYGGGFPESQVKKVVGNLIRAKGIKALQLSDKPELERAFVQFAGLVDSENVV